MQTDKSLNHDAAPRSPAVTPIKVLFFGDSITKGVLAAIEDRPAVTAADIFVTRVTNQLREAGFVLDATNAGVSSDRTDGALARLGGLLADGPDLVVMMFGTNDSCIDIGQSEPRLAIDQFELNLRRMVGRCHQAGARCVLMTEPGLGENWLIERHAIYRERGQNYSLRPFMEVVRRVAVETGAGLIDHFSDWDALDVATTNQHIHDGCHPNARGHERMARRIVSYLLSDLMTAFPGRRVPYAPQIESETHVF